VNRLCEAYDYALGNTNIDPLLLMPMFILDFLCIHPFSDGNGRMSRLLTLLPLYRQDYLVGKYISIEKLINSSKETYYEALQESSWNWHEGENDYSSFVRYILGVVLAAYKEFAERVEYVADKKMKAAERVAVVFIRSVAPINKAYIMEKCPDISETTIERSLSELLNNKRIEKLGNGRNTMYKWII
jgi:Fic family protein